MRRRALIAGVLAGPAAEIARAQGVQRRPRIGLLIPGSSASFAERIAALAIAQRLPMISTLRDFVDDGLLASYGPDLLAMYRRAAYYVDRVLRGARPADLPVEQPAVLQLILNLRTARALGLAFSPVLLARADEVIE